MWVFALGPCLLLAGNTLYDAPIDHLYICYIEHPPYYYTDGGQAKGILVAKVKAILEAAHIRHEFKPMPVKRALERVAHDHNAISIGWFRTESRERCFIFSHPIYTNKPQEMLVLSKRAVAFKKHHTFKDLMNDNLFRLGAIIGYSEGDYCDTIIKNHIYDVHYIAGTPEQLLKMLYFERIDGFLVAPEEIDSLVAAAGIHRNEVTSIRLDDIPAGNSRHIIFNKNTPHGVIAKINAVIRSLENKASLAPPHIPAAGSDVDAEAHQQQTGAEQ